MRNFLFLSAIYLFAPQLSTAGNFDDLRRTLTSKMPEIVIGDIRKLPYADLYEIQANDVNVFYTDSKGEVALFGSGKQDPGPLPRAQIEALLNFDGES